MIKYSPQTNKAPIIAFVVFLLVSSLVFILFSFFVGTASSYIMRIIGMCLLFAATVIVSRYLSFTYLYVLDETDLVIVKCTKNTENALCRLNYGALYEICEYHKAIQRIKEEKIHVTNYCSNLFPKKAYCLFYDMGNESGVISFEPNDFFAVEIQKRIKVDIEL